MDEKLTLTNEDIEDIIMAIDVAGSESYEPKNLRTTWVQIVEKLLEMKTDEDN